MKRKTGHSSNYFIVFLLCCYTVTYSQESQGLEASIDSLELQQTYIRNLVEQQKKQILKNSKAEALSKELDASKLNDIDSVAAEKVKISEQKNAPLKEAVKEYVPRKSALRKTLVIGGLSACAVAGVLVYFLTKGDKKGGTGSDPSIDDKPPLHP